MIRIGIIEDNDLLLQNYTDFFDCQENYEVSFGFESILNLQKTIKTQKIPNPDIILLDINLPGITGIEGISILKSYFPRVKIVMLTAYSDSDSIIKSIENGASGYLEKGISLQEIKSSLETHQKGGSATTPLVVKKLIDHINNISKNKEEILAKLTKREKEVVQSLIEGLSYKDAALSLNVSSSTINQHLKKIYIKLGIKSKSELMSKILH